MGGKPLQARSQLVQQLLWLRLGGKWEAGTEVRDLGRGRLLKDLTCLTCQDFMGLV